MKFYSNGKLLITSEYLVLDGAKAFALPTKYGQYLEVETQNNNHNILFWESFDNKNNCWFKADFDLKDFNFSNATDKEIAKTLQLVLTKARALNPIFLKSEQSINVKTTLTFDRNWGLGSSSTLINNIAKWAKIDAYKLQFNTFGGSAYDIACANNNTPIIYSLSNKNPKVEPVKFDPSFKDNLFFVYLNRKQNSRNAIDNYKKNTESKSEIIKNLNEITTNLIKSKSLSEFEFLLKNHENILSKILKTETVQSKYFKDYFGQIKSLGAWGGDFILVTGNEKTPNYFKEKGFETVISYKNMILNS